MITLYKGRRGKGKTLTMIKDAYLDHLNGKVVYSNMKSVKFAIYITNEKILSITKKSEYRKCVFLIDEIQTLFNSRRSMKTENINFSFFLQQIRKREIELRATSQFSNTIDLTFRQHVDFICDPDFDKELLVCKVTYIDINNIDENNPEDMNNRVVVVYDAREIFGLYDTKEIIA